MNYNDLFEKIMRELRSHNPRPALKLDAHEFQELATQLHQLEKNHLNDNQEEILKILCILGHTQTMSPLFTESLLRILRDETAEPDLLIFTLAAVEKHVILLNQRNGERVPYSLIQALRKLLQNPHPEILEWTLKTIEGLGGQGILLREDIQKIRLGPFSFLDPHRRASKKIIEHLVKKWRPPESYEKRC